MEQAPKLRRVVCFVHWAATAVEAAWVRRVRSSDPDGPIAEGMALKGIDDLCVVVAGEDHLRQFKETWVLYYIGKVTTDKTWTWRLFPWDEIIEHPYYSTVAAVDAEGKLEGLIAIRRASPFLKIEFVATAPWNHGKERRRKGVGPALLRWAIEISMTIGFNGALTLSSTPESESFYEAKGFVRTGERDKEGLSIFQLPPERVPKFLAATQGFMTLEVT